MQTEEIQLVESSNDTFVDYVQKAQNDGDDPRISPIYTRNQTLDLLSGTENPKARRVILMEKHGSAKPKFSKNIKLQGDWFD